ncbi:MAG: 2-oxo acid dehydrogenase subunit E2 [Fimbriimonadaceae bacterium]|nr:2-oxo acid dehydrogenase subunit E2 [Fimbriimonadaceae bacterium]
MTEVIMPKMGDGMEEGTLLEWLKKDGETVKSGEIIGTIQTDKATLELESPSSGTLTGFLIAGGDTVPVGKSIAAILKAGETLPAGWGSGESKPAEVAVAASVEVKAEPELVAVGSSAAPGAGRIKASPLAKRIAEEKGVDLTQVEGTGPGGRIIERDVLKAEPGEKVAAVSVTVAPTGADQVIKLSRLRQIIAQRTQQAKQEVPHFYVTVEVDCERMLALREMFEEDGSGKVSINDFMIKASVLALQEMPQVNATFNSEGTVTQFGGVHIGVAAAVDEGLLVPVIKNAQNYSLRQLSSMARDLVAKARDGKLLPDEMSGSTFSISNMGMLDVDNFAAIINQPNCAIVAVSSARKKVVVNDEDEAEIRTRMNITGSFDHRVLDGAVGAKFMNVLRSYLENPTKLLS